MVESRAIRAALMVWTALLAMYAVKTLRCPGLAMQQEPAQHILLALPRSDPLPAEPRARSLGELAFPPEAVDTTEQPIPTPPPAPPKANTRDEEPAVESDGFQAPPVHAGPDAAERVFHVIWKRPKESERGVWGKGRVLSDKLVSGCCDSIIRLCVLSVLAHYPTAQVNIWSNDFTQDEFARHIHNDRRALVRNYDLDSLSADTPAQPWFQDHPKAHFEAVHFSDMLRYLLMYIYGGTYIDADSILMRTLEDLATHWSLPPENVTMLMARQNDHCGKRTIDNNGRNPRWMAGYLKEEGSEGRHCATYLSNGMLYRFPAKATFFWRSMQMFAENYHPECYGCGGPTLVTRAFNQCLEAGEPIPHFQQWRRMIRFSFHNVLMDKPRQSHDLLIEQKLRDPDRTLVWHSKLDKGDIQPGSTANHFSRHFLSIVQAQPEHREL